MRQDRASLQWDSTAEVVALRLAGQLPRPYRWYAKHIVVALTEITGPSIRRLALETTLDEITDWPDVPCTTLQLAAALNNLLPFRLELGDPLDAPELTFRELVEKTSWSELARTAFEEYRDFGESGPLRWRWG
jgi:hypothetical protein